MGDRAIKLQRNLGILLTLFLLTTGIRANAQSDQDKLARELLAQKLLKLSQSPDMKEASFKDSKGGGGKDYNYNDGNSFVSYSTYHSNVWDYCMQWVGGQYCQKWLDPYVSPHGFGHDQSPLEGLVASEWKQMKKDNDDGQSGHYGIWEVAAQGGGSVLDVDGKLDRSRLTKFQIAPQVQRKIQNLGERIAVHQISLTYDDSTGKGERTMPNMESLRLMAQRWTKMYRNRMVSNLGELRAMDPGTEVALNEDYPTCDAYARELQTNMDQTGIEERIQPQARLDPETRARTLQERLDNCRKLRMASVSMVNPQVSGNSIQSGDPNGEQIDKWRSRVSIATIDNVGINPNSVPKPSWAKLEKYEYSNKMRDYQIGGLTSKQVSMTNADQLRSYNDNLERAAVGLQEVSARTGGYVVDNSERVRGYKIQPGSGVSAVALNGLTGEMKGELAGTSFPVASTNYRSPASTVEDKPSELTINRKP